MDIFWLAFKMPVHVALSKSEIGRVCKDEAFVVADSTDALRKAKGILCWLVKKLVEIRKWFKQE